MPECHADHGDGDAVADGFVVDVLLADEVCAALEDEVALDLDALGFGVHRRPIRIHCIAGQLVCLENHGCEVALLSAATGAATCPVAGVELAVGLVGWIDELVCGEVLEVEGGDMGVHVGDLTVGGDDEPAGIDLCEAEQELARGLRVLGLLGECVGEREAGEPALAPGDLVVVDHAGEAGPVVSIAPLLAGLAAVEAELLALAGLRLALQHDSLGVFVIGENDAADAALDVVGVVERPCP